MFTDPLVHRLSTPLIHRCASPHHPPAALEGSPQEPPPKAKCVGSLGLVSLCHQCENTRVANVGVVVFAQQLHKLSQALEKEEREGETGERDSKLGDRLRHEFLREQSFEIHGETTHIGKSSASGVARASLTVFTS